ncbi:hypothetical protein [Leisingera sp. NJS204]|uniref:hypothetical protein n=1 Tax=Leisingera sp. NJS204 TaxID=2508307 RepID=UPI001013BFA2|nr:hypothetical protein [Leisingera sp. NJS204]QAX31291.1 hypothetical protein ETW24_18970 [Leisingera sp. NJS204]
MAYHIKFEDQGQDLTHLVVNAETGVIEDAGLLTWMFGDGSCVVETGELTEDRMVRYQQYGTRKTFKYPMIRLELDGELLAEAA